MAFKITARCSFCSGKFSYSSEARDFSPRFCPLCGADHAEQEAKRAEGFADMLATNSPPHFQHNVVVRSVDQTYAQMENSSIARAQEAASMLGVPESEMSALKITNLKDSTQFGEDMAVTPVNEVSKMMDAAPQTTGLVNPSAPNPHANAQVSQMNDYRRANQTGPAAGSGGATFNNLIKPGHHARREAWANSGLKVKV